MVEAAEIETGIVREDNTVSYRRNFYSVPITNCQPGDEVGLTENAGILSITKLNSQKTVAKHRVSRGQGKLVRNNNHYRDYREKIPAIYNRVLALLTNTPDAVKFLVSIKKKQKPSD